MMMAKRKKLRGQRPSPRRTDNRAIRRRILIVCEGKRTEPNYFRAFRLQSDVKTVVIGKGYNTVSLVDEAIRLREKDQKEQAKKEQEPYQQVSLPYTFWLSAGNQSLCGLLSLANPTSDGYYPVEVRHLPF